jgi:hypothetical protein
MAEQSMLPEYSAHANMPDKTARRAAAGNPGPPDDANATEGTTLFAALVEAIDRELVLLVRFRGETESRRICPDRIGIDAHDQYQVEAFQLGGPSASDTGTDQWKCFHLRDLELVGTEAEGWKLGPRATAAGRCFHQVVYPVPGTA